MDFRLRPASEDDRQFLYALHCKTMREVIEKTWGWDDAWQREDFDRRFSEYTVSIIEREERSAGGLWLEFQTDAVYIGELQLLPEFQGVGVGTAVVKHVIDQGASRGLAVTLSVVEANERAKHLYERLGFIVKEVEPPFIRMRRDSGPTSRASQ